MTSTAVEVCAHLPGGLMDRNDKLQQCVREASSLLLCLGKHLQEPGVPGSVQWHNCAVDSSCCLWQ